MGPFMLGHLDLMMRSHFRSKGYGFFKINRLMEGFNHNTVNMSVAEADINTPGSQEAFEGLCSNEAQIGAVKEIANGAVGALGDGTILQNLIAAIKAFAASSFGQAVIAALEKLLLGFLGV